MIPGLAGFLASGVLPISVLNAFADTGAVDEASAGSFSVSAGRKRLLVHFLHLTGDTDTVSGITWGMAKR